MVESNSIESIDHNSIDTSNLNNQQFRLNKISEIEEIKQRELMSKKLSKYISFSDYSDKSLIFLSETSGGVSIAFFATVIGAPIGIASASLSLAFSLCTGLVKKLLKATRNKKKKHNKIVMLARSKLNSIESKISEALISSQISHKDFITIINEETNYRELKEGIRMMKGQEDRLINLFKYKTILSYCLKCKKNQTNKQTESVDPKVSAPSNGRTMILPKCAMCDSKKSKLIKKQEAKGLLSNLGIRTPLSKISLLGDVLF